MIPKREAADASLFYAEKPTRVEKSMKKWLIYPKKWGKVLAKW